MARTGGTSDQLRVIDYWWVTCTGGFGRCGGGGGREGGVGSGSAGAGVGRGFVGEEVLGMSFGELVWSGNQ